MNNQMDNFTPLDNEEQALSASFEAGEWQVISLNDKDKQAYISAAQHTLKNNKRQQININFNLADINIIKIKAQETGIPYQNIISALVHNYAVGKIKLEI